MFMYFLARHLSRGNELISILAGLVFEFAPLKMAAISHLQNLSIFYLPLILLLLLCHFKKSRRRTLFGLFVVLVLQFYASWYQMIFILFALGAFLLVAAVTKLTDLKNILLISLVIALAVITTLPLAKEYVRFSKQHQATFGIADQVKYSSSLVDYVIPNDGTISGKLYHHLWPKSKINSYNPDSYSYHGLVLFWICTVTLTAGYFYRKKNLQFKYNYKLLLAFTVIGLVGFIVSLGPLLKIRGNPLTYVDATSGVHAAFALPYLLVDKFLPQLDFIRAVGRASVLTLFAFCAIFALAPVYLPRLNLRRNRGRMLSVTLALLIMIDVLPVRHAPMVHSAYAHNLRVPAVYQFIGRRQDINNIIILAADGDYPGATIPVARAEWVLWAGYHNKNIFNGYSGYTPPSYFEQLGDFLDFRKDDIPKLKKLGIKYVLVDKQLSSSRPQMVTDVRNILHIKIYEDSRYALFKAS
jgi:hypothetical protein